MRAAAAGKPFLQAAAVMPLETPGGARIKHPAVQQQSTAHAGNLQQLEGVVSGYQLKTNAQAVAFGCSEVFLVTFGSHRHAAESLGEGDRIRRLGAAAELKTEQPWTLSTNFQLVILVVQQHSSSTPGVSYQEEGDQQQYTWGELSGGGGSQRELRKLERLLRLLLLLWPRSIARSSVLGVGDPAAAAVASETGAARLAAATGATGVAGGAAAPPAARGGAGGAGAEKVAATGAAATGTAAVKGGAGRSATKKVAEVLGAHATAGGAAGAAVKKTAETVAAPAAARGAAGVVAAVQAAAAGTARAGAETAASHSATQGGTAAESGTGGCSAWKDEADLSLGVPDGSDCCMWLLLLAALLQQASAEAKQQLMQQQERTLLLQLLHRVLLDQEQTGDKVGRAGCIWLADEPLSVTLQQLHAGVYAQPQLSADGCWGPVLAGAPMGVEQLVLMVLQSLLMTADVADAPVTAEQLVSNGCMLELTEGKLWWPLEG